MVVRGDATTDANSDARLPEKARAFFSGDAERRLVISGRPRKPGA
jgi:hypothetical protein